jgi:ABC-type transport system involved in multi-copper enzyme maturation permease subunit
MNGVMTLVGHSLRRWRGFLVATALMLIAFQFFMIVAARSLELSGRFGLLEAVMPAFMSQWTNMAAASFAGFVLFGYSHPLVQLFLVATAIGIGSEPAGEVETKFIDLLMARPLARGVAINRTLVVLVLMAVGATACMLTATWTGLQLLAPATARQPQLRVVVSLAVNLACLVLAWGGIALALASLSRRRATVAAACGLLAFAMFVLDYVGRFWDAVAPIARVSPFHYFDPFGMMGGQPLAMLDLVTLLGVFVVGAVIANLAYSRRDL